MPTKGPLAAVLLLTSLGTARADDLPKNHPIHDVSEVFTRDAPDEVSIASVGSLLRWSFTLTKVEVEAGEPLCGILEVTNTSDRFVVELSPPYAGALVTTVGVWCARLDGQPAGRADGLREVVRNRKGFERTRGLFPGRPLRLAPGARHRVELPINVYQEGPADGSRLESYAWLPAAGFARPGRYRVFLRYLDLECEVAYAATFPGPELELAARRDDDPLELPRAPVVLGPFEVTVRPARDAARADALVAWEAAYLDAFPRLCGLPTAPDVPAADAPASPGEASWALARLRDACAREDGRPGAAERLEVLLARGESRSASTRGRSGRATG